MANNVELARRQAISSARSLNDLFIHRRPKSHQHLERAVREEPSRVVLIGIARVEDWPQPQHGDSGARRNSVIEVRRQALAHRAVEYHGHAELSSGRNALFLPKLGEDG